jgi:hypothetical protein
MGRLGKTQSRLARKSTKWRRANLSGKRVWRKEQAEGMAMKNRVTAE